MAMREDEAARRASFNELVEQGVYSEEFDHPPALKRFVAEVLAQNTPLASPGQPLRILDCGCGPGVWLEFLLDRLQGDAGSIACYGFDVSDGMVELARRRLMARHESVAIQQGDLLSKASYVFESAPNGFDLIFVFDVVQQLPRRLQYVACEMILDSLRPGGVALLFDHDRKSEYGRRMGRRKLITKYLGIPLVPRYYCDARYPPLSAFAQQISRTGRFSAAVTADDATPKMALVVKAAREQADAS